MLTQERIDDLLGLLPHGSGFDIDWSHSRTPEADVFCCEYHEMSEHGFYIGWSPITITVTDDDWEAEVESCSGDESLWQYVEDTVAFALAEE